MRYMRTLEESGDVAMWGNWFPKCIFKRGTYSEGINFASQGVLYENKSFRSYMVEV
jgi:hypothetical protein